MIVAKDLPQTLQHAGHHVLQTLGLPDHPVTQAYFYQLILTPSIINNKHNHRKETKFTNLVGGQIELSFVNCL
jgi:hypothetical protein